MVDSCYRYLKESDNDDRKDWRNCQVLRMICNGLMDSHIKHGGALWGNAARRELKRLGIMSNKAAKIISGCGLERKVNELHNVMGWQEW